jgi:hypothetical protein
MQLLLKNSLLVLSQNINEMWQIAEFYLLPDQVTLKYSLHFKTLKVHT